MSGLYLDYWHGPCSVEQFSCGHISRVLYTAMNNMYEGRTFTVKTMFENRYAMSVSCEFLPHTRGTADFLFKTCISPIYTSNGFVVKLALIPTKLSNVPENNRPSVLIRGNERM